LLQSPSIFPYKSLKTLDSTEAMEIVFYFPKATIILKINKFNIILLIYAKKSDVFFLDNLE